MRYPWYRSEMSNEELVNGLLSDAGEVAHMTARIRREAPSNEPTTALLREIFTAQVNSYRKTAEDELAASSRNMWWIAAILLLVFFVLSGG